MRGEHNGSVLLITLFLLFRSWRWHTTAASAAAVVARIALKERDLVGSDAVLEGELARRMSPPAFKLNLSLSHPAGASAGADDDLLHPDFFVTDPPNTRKMLNSHSPELRIGGLNETRRSEAYPKDPSDEQVGRMAINMIEQACYSTQYRLKELAPVIKEYSDDHRFRIGYILMQLEEWEEEMTMAYLHAQETWTNVRGDGRGGNFYKCMYYYAHAARKMIDVTYTVEHQIQLHELLLKEYDDSTHIDPQ